MSGMSMTLRVSLIDRLRELVLERRQRVTPCDLAVYRALSLDFHNSRTGRCDPGYRAIARKAKVALGTVVACVRRLTRAGFIKVRRRLVYAGRWLRWTNCYELPAEPRSGSAAEPLKKISKEGRPVDKPRSVAQQLALLAPFIQAERAGARCLRGGLGSSWEGPGAAPWNPGGNSRGGGVEPSDRPQALPVDSPAA